jgi:hypothetical protein
VLGCGFRGWENDRGIVMEGIEGVEEEVKMRIGERGS